MSKFNGKYRNETTRAQWWDYTTAGSYFITICTKNKEHHFGEIHDGKMHLSQCGVLADVFWYEILNHANNIELGAFTVMPNHVHGILTLKGDPHTNTHKLSGNNWSKHKTEFNQKTSTPIIPVGTGHALSLPRTTENVSNIQPIASHHPHPQQKNSVSAIIGSYKSAVTKHANRLGFPNSWQTRFYDNIIKDQAAFNQITRYIINNPSTWASDRFG